MATIYERKNKDGTSSWRVMFRRKGLKTFCASFATEQQARKFAQCFEQKFFLENESINWDRLRSRGEREFHVKNKIQ